jgi:hypothetical protein
MTVKSRIPAIPSEGGIVCHTYSTYSRGLDGLWGMYRWLVRAPKGRNETGVWRRQTSTTSAERGPYRNLSERLTLQTLRMNYLAPPAFFGLYGHDRV